MKTLEIERGKSLEAPHRWVDFVVKHPDILAALNQSALRAKRVAGNKFVLSIFGLRVFLEEVHHSLTAAEGSLKYLADIRLPWGLGHTHTITHYRYRPIDEDTTALELSITIELTSWIMQLYASVCRDRLDHYLNALCRHVEAAARALHEENADALNRLEESQKEEVQVFRRALPRRSRTESRPLPKVDGALRIVLSESMLLVTAEARLPDQRILNANGRFTLTPEERTSLCSGMMELAVMNQRASPARGNSQEPPGGIDFRQAALEHGCRLYRTMCAEQLSSVVPVITSLGQAARLRLTIEGEAEQLPWEAMHDGQEFLCIKTCLSRSVTTIHEQQRGLRDWQTSGVLVIGADSRGDLSGVEPEAKGIGKMLIASGLPRVEVLTGAKAHRKSVLKALQSGEFGIVHFSGHSSFDQDHPQQSFLELCSGSRIYLHELGHFGRAGSQDAPLGLVFLNSCQSAKVGHDAVTGKHLSMCKALRESGVSYVIGMLWNVEDEAAVQVGAGFYGNLMGNPEDGPEGAMRKTRLAVAIDREWADGSWLAPVLYA